ncbi:MAG: DNA gyrase C-terminal beta-propeller domain-containing protein, partial [Alloprevotella sp.]
GDSINACLHIRKLADAEFCESHYVMFCTKNGIIKKTCLKEYSRPRANGVNAITIREEDRVVSVALTNGTDEIVMANRNGRAIRFNESTVRTMGRTATGVRGMRLDEDGQDEVIGMVAVNNPETESILVVSEKGYGKRSMIADYRVTNRSGKGVKTLSLTDKTGSVVAIKCVTDDDDLMIINKSGVAIRLKLSEVRVMGRATQGVRLINLEKRGDVISSVCQVPTEEEEQPEETELSENPVDSVPQENLAAPEFPENPEVSQEQ